MSWCGTVYATSTTADAGDVIGVEGLRRAGVVGAVMGAEDPAAACARLLLAMEERAS